MNHGDRRRQGGPLGAPRDGFSQALGTDTGSPITAGPDGLFGLYRLKPCHLRQQRRPGLSRQPPTAEGLSLPDPDFLAGSREQVGENASLAGLLADAPRGVTGRSSRREIGKTGALLVRVLPTS